MATKTTRKTKKVYFAYGGNSCEWQKFDECELKQWLDEQDENELEWVEVFVCTHSVTVKAPPAKTFTLTEKAL